MLFSIFLITISPYTAFVPIIYMAYRIIKKKETIDKNPWNIGLLLLAAWSAISGTLNHSLLSAGLSFAVFLYFCLSVYLQNHFDDEDKIENLCRKVVGLSTVTAVIGITEKIVFSHYNSSLWKKIFMIPAETAANHRIYSTFGNPNVAGNWFAAMILISFYFVNRTEDKRKRLPYQVAMVLFAAALFLTGSRGASMGLLAGLGTYYLMRKNSENVGYIAVLFVIMACVVFLPAQLLNINGIISHEVSSSVRNRYEIWDGCFRMFTLKPFAGWGLMGIFSNGLDYINYDTKVFHAHNIWLTFATTLGIVGLSIYCYMKYHVFTDLKELYNQNCRLVPMFASIQALIVVHGFVDFTIMTPQAGMIFITCSSMISALAVKYRAESITVPSVKKVVPVVSIRSLSKLS